MIAQPTATLTPIGVGLAEIKIADASSPTLAGYGVGSCIILCAWDGARRIGGMAHVVQPASPTGVGNDARFADRAVPLLLERLSERGVVRGRLIVKMAGGASLLNPGAKPSGETLGHQNARAVESALTRSGLQLSASDIGGKHGRTMIFDVLTGTLRVRRLGGEEQTL